ncbi:hypothetical protein ASE26_04505 [Duganella sp. Root198D2]|nr:hypothetical protein ASE26_04505 [Duganella sp. Root198D2]
MVLILGFLAPPKPFGQGLTLHTMHETIRAYVFGQPFLMACNKFDGEVSLARDFSIFIFWARKLQVSGSLALHSHSPMYSIEKRCDAGLDK